MRNQRKVLVTTPTVDAKSCTRCRKHKPASEFYRQNTSHDGLRSWCKVRRRHPPALGSAGQRWAALGSSQSHMESRCLVPLCSRQIERGGLKVVGTGCCVRIMLYHMARQLHTYETINQVADGAILPPQTCYSSASAAKSKSSQKRPK